MVSWLFQLPETIILIEKCAALSSSCTEITKKPMRRLVLGESFQSTKSLNELIGLIVVIPMICDRKVLKPKQLSIGGSGRMESTSDKVIRRNNDVCLHGKMILKILKPFWAVKKWKFHHQRFKLFNSTYKYSSVPSSSLNKKWILNICWVSHSE